jgi:hypothetical protein
MLEEVDWLNPITDHTEFFVEGKTPSQRDGLLLVEELRFRYVGSHLVQRAGRLLKMFYYHHYWVILICVGHNPE